jgi:hypothetical protein
MPANRHLLSPLDRRLFAHPAQIPHANRPGIPAGSRSYPLIPAKGRPAHPAGDRLVTDPRAAHMQAFRLCGQQAARRSRGKTTNERIEQARRHREAASRPLPLGEAQLQIVPAPYVLNGPPSDVAAVAADDARPTAARARSSPSARTTACGRRRTSRLASAATRSPAIRAAPSGPPAQPVTATTRTPDSRSRPRR